MALKVENLSADDVLALKPRLIPGKSSNAGFIGKDEDLKLLTAKDEATLKRLGWTWNQYAVAVSYVCGLAYDQCHRKSNKITEVKGSAFVTEILMTLGRQECPFCIHGNTRNVETNPSDGSGCYVFCREGKANKKGKYKDKDRFVIQSMHPHLIYHHHFCEGTKINSDYRCDPERFISFFGLEPEEFADVPAYFK